GKAPASIANGPAGAGFAVAQRRVPFAEPAGPVTLAFSPDGQVVVARGPDLSIHVWDAASGAEVAHVKGHEGRVETLAFAPDGKTIASGGADTTILLWNAAMLLKDLPKTEHVEIPYAAVETLWNDLAGENAVKAVQSLLTLARTPNQAVPF